MRFIFALVVLSLDKIQQNSERPDPAVSGESIGVAEAV
jgi:hypothetical protein